MLAVAKQAGYKKTRKHFHDSENVEILKIRNAYHKKQGANRIENLVPRKTWNLAGSVQYLHTNAVHQIVAKQGLQTLDQKQAAQCGKIALEKY